VLGALIEKESTTPEYYPLSLNALVNACNQKSNRHPVVSYDEATVAAAIEALRAKRFCAVIVGNGRVHKYAQRFSETLNLGRRELALLCTLMLRGPQTLGELRDRSERMHNFEDLAEVESCLERMSEMVTRLPRQPGQKEARYAHLLSGPVEAESFVEEHAAAPDRIAALESEIKTLREQMQSLERQFADFRRQFE
jgi:uncharacterized protein YceH (UPF0502 family)